MAKGKGAPAGLRWVASSILAVAKDINAKKYDEKAAAKKFAKAIDPSELKTAADILKNEGEERFLARYGKKQKVAKVAKKLSLQELPEALKEALADIEARLQVLDAEASELRDTKKKYEATLKSLT